MLRQQAYYSQPKPKQIESFIFCKILKAFDLQIEKHWERSAFIKCWAEKY